ncbi:MAG: glycerol-3-phosphate dehydrogenase (NAD(P)+) [Parcubacteria group bacterium Athens0714_26]|nr:MAG: glycerol-3-phosphate dehydrogenase (NAD(P)+) [Parcubacteria group bacterium Athens1014_26]TSD03562.1 MAG: glycerol-3-phosphate dehydrogenase (NAD(P)+) [Parcubacteria group bacterium Athens0714_26]
MDKKVVIIGAGEIGTAIAKSLKDVNTADIFLWDKDTLKVPEQKPLSEIVPQADFVFFCVPSWIMRVAVAEVSQYLIPKAIIISLAKGIEVETLKTMNEVLGEALPKGQKFALLSGPMIAEELVAGARGFGVVATASEEVYSSINNLFKNTNIFTEYSADIRGVALSAVLKNVYAVSLGIADGLKWSGNAKSWLAAKAIKEMSEISEILGGTKETILGTAGLGDLLATGFSEHSRNHQIGDELVKTGKILLKGEGVASLNSVLKLLGEKSKDFVLLSALAGIIINGEDAKSALEKLR